MSKEQQHIVVSAIGNMNLEGFTFNKTVIEAIQKIVVSSNKTMVANKFIKELVNKYTK
jgi:hypothetical protein